MEFTSRGDFAFEIFGELNKYALSQLPGMILGVGSTSLGLNFIFFTVSISFSLPYSIFEINNLSFEVSVELNKATNQSSEGSP